MARIEWAHHLLENSWQEKELDLVAKYGDSLEGQRKGGSRDQEVALVPSGDSMLFQRALGRGSSCYSCPPPHLAINPCSFWLGCRQSGAK